MPMTDRQRRQAEDATVLAALARIDRRRPPGRTLVLDVAIPRDVATGDQAPEPWLAQAIVDAGTIPPWLKATDPVVETGVGPGPARARVWAHLVQDTAVMPLLWDGDQA